MDGCKPLSPGVDPTANLRQLAAAKGLGDRFFSVALGQGQAPVATKLISTATVEGNWVFLARPPHSSHISCLTPDPPEGAQLKRPRRDPSEPGVVWPVMLLSPPKPMPTRVLSYSTSAPSRDT